MKRILTLFFLLALINGVVVPCAAQSVPDSNVTSNFNQWLMVVGEYRTNENSKWAFAAEGHLRVANLGGAWQQWILRPWVHFDLNKNVQIHVGYTWVRNFPYGEQPISTATPEHNIWQQVLVKHSISNIQLYHRLRLEERFIGIEQKDNEGHWELDHFQYANRLRYRIGGNLPGKGKLKNYYLAVFNEAFIDFSKSSGNYRWNQNWIYAGLGRKLNPHNIIQLGYQHQWIRKSDGVHRENNHIIQFTWKFLLNSNSTKS